MQIIRGLKNLKYEHRRSVVTIGNFDGVHLGHQAILAKIKSKSIALGVPSMIICFEPQPKEFFDEFNAPARLTRFREKVELLSEHGVDLVLCLKFDEKTRSISDEEFAKILFEDIGATAVFVGDDFRFGSDREGDFPFLHSRGVKIGVPVRNLYTLTLDTARVSSTRIRESLAQGDFKMAESLLKRPYTIAGRVIYGRSFGRNLLDIPTANIQLRRYRAPIDGSYAVEVSGLDKIYQGVANVGVRPTIDNTTLSPLLEVHIFDLNADIYGRVIKVRFIHKIRDEKKFPDLAALKSAIHQDIKEAKQFFSESLGT